jgi:threonine-phosphate decarboxylase
VFCRPNPSAVQPYETGDLLAFVERCRAAGTTAVVDETFLPLTGRPTLAGIDGVVVLRSLGESYGLPGLRMGVAIATGEIRDRLETARTSWSLSVPGAAVGEHCLRQETFLAESRERIAEERERLRARLATRFDLTADGVFFRLETDDPAALSADLREEGLVVGRGEGRTGWSDQIVFSQRTPSENDELLDALGV